MAASEEDVEWIRSSFRAIPRPQLPDDCVEYSLHLVAAGVDAANDSETRSPCKDLRPCAIP